MNRRNFLRNTGLASTSLFVPQFLSGYNRNGFAQNGKNLVIIQWSGGNDGLNTLVPFQNDLYYQKRPKLAIPKNKVLRVTDELGFNPMLGGLKNLYDEGLLTVINNVGYPNPVRSHFRSMDIWHTASGSDQYWQTGWLGRYLDQASSDYIPHRALEVDDALVLALKGENRSGFAASDPAKLKRAANNRFLQKIAHHHDHDHEDNVEYLYKTLIDTQSSADYLFEKNKDSKRKGSYPSTQIGKDLATIANLITKDSNTKIYYINMSGFDTHVYQNNRQSRLLKQYNDAIKIFIKDLQKNQKIDDTLIMTFSEFGRRVKENASQGTDHGTANNVYFMGGKLKNPGIFNEAPNLSALDNGDLIYSVDFRRIYASVLKNWLGVDPGDVLLEKFKPLGIV